MMSTLACARWPHRAKCDKEEVNEAALLVNTLDFIKRSFFFV